MQTVSSRDKLSARGQLQEYSGFIAFCSSLQDYGAVSAYLAYTVHSSLNTTTLAKPVVQLLAEKFEIELIYFQI